MNQRVETFWDLRRFLKTENVEIEGLMKSELRNWYTNEYKTYKQQISPDEKLPTFFLIMQAVYKLKIAHYEDEKLVLGPSPEMKKEREKTAKQKPQKQKHLKQMRVTENVNQRDKSSSQSSAQKSAQRSPQRDVHEEIARHEDGTMTLNGKMVTRKQLMKRHRMAVDQHLTFKSGLAKVVNQPDFKGDPNEWKFIGKTERGFYCTLCQSKLTSHPDAERHLEGRKHRLATSMNLIRSKKDKLVEGSPTISITADTEEKEGTYFINTEEEIVKMVEITITNKGDVPVELAHCEMMKKVRVFTLRDSKKVTDGMGTAKLSPGDSYKIQVRTQAQHVGNYHCPLMFHFIVRGQNGKQNGYILRYLHCKCKNSLIDDMKPTTKYKRPPRVNKGKGAATEIVPGFKLPSSTGDYLERDIELPGSTVPQNVRKMINRGLIDQHGLTEQEINEMGNLRCVLDADLDMVLYQRRFKTLLFFEEVQMEVDIRKYDMENVPMRNYSSNSRLLLLEVPGLSENRPSVLRGDWLFVSQCDAEGNRSKREYQGYVHEVLQNEVALGFDKSFRDSFIENQKFNVRFVFNRLPIRLQHRACQLACELSLGEILFPHESRLQKNVELPDLKLYNQDLEKNEQQKYAVQHIIAGTSKPAPYLVFGPPGTGKTVTIVEAIKQIWKCTSSSHILACTPSNSAADLIAKRLIQHIPKSEIIRLNAASRSWAAVPEEIKCVCNYNKDTRHFYYPRKSDLQKYRIIITTLVTAGRLVSANFPSGHFSHVFIDEAGHAPEPEALIALAGIMEVNPALQTGGQVVIAGDPKQLGPILRSPLAIKYGLDISLLERYMESCDLYLPSGDEGGHKSYDVRVITKLLNNYRSHPAILKLPNEIFYDNELVPCAGIDREKLCRWEGLQKQGFPLVFHGVVGEDMREERSPSFFNPQEVSIVVQYVEDLMTCKKGGINLKQSDIGVISPYRKQVQKIKQVLRKKKYDKISVGSVEEFQGQERTVIIVSTVRSKPEYMSFDMQFRLGFLRNPKRFNVTVTRAKALLIVIGNPNTLSGDLHWKQLIDYCDENGAYRGTERMSEDDELEDLIQRLAAVELIDDECRLIPEIQSDYNEQAWRSDI
ncbi:putative helicase MOV-10 [Mercenaria mercenaria]|uniref:putative helicase MOV-10 n=1 Tax=Mercenaria mercenaria TaxID=6596 RepID=UPI00234EC96D|nr:putative helicase MOV-10 [Mercenaria mercenaria]